MHTFTKTQKIDILLVNVHIDNYTITYAVIQEARRTIAALRIYKFQYVPLRRALSFPRIHFVSASSYASSYMNAGLCKEDP